MGDGLEADAQPGDPPEVPDGAAPTDGATPTDGESGTGHATSRRVFLAGAGAAGGAVALDVVFAHARQVTELQSGVTSIIGELPGIIENTKPSFTFLLRRREDFLLLRVDGYNLVRHGQKLVRKSKGPAYLVFVHQPQHVLEQAFVDPGGHPKTPGRSKALLAYPSRLAFKLPSGKHSIPLTVAGLLDWAALEPSLAPSAAYNPPFVIARDIANPGHGTTPPIHLPTAKPPKWPPKAPKATQTAIELPWHLVISPGTAGTWSHPTNVIQARGWAELWHTRLAASSAEAAADGGTFRAIWNFDVDGNRRPTLKSGSPPPDSASPFLTSLDSNDRYQIVQATSNFKNSGRADVQANKLWLSARGGFLDSNGVWESLPPFLNLEQWKHLATLGRDHYVKVVKKGFLFPFGHRAVEVVITERLFEKVGVEIVATSRQITYLVVREPTKSYDPSDTFGIANDSRDLPFRSLTITTLRTPNITKPTFVSGGFSQNPFVPTVGGKPFMWHFIGTDWIGQQVDFTAAAVFVVQPDAFTSSLASKVRSTYNGLGVTDVRRLGQFTGQEVAFGASHTPGDTNLQVKTITFGAGAGSGGSLSQYEDSDQPITYPYLAQAEVALSAAEQASGGAALGTTPVVNYHSKYINDGGPNTGGFNTAANKGNLFMEIAASSQPALNFGGGSSGAVITPNLQLSGLSRSLGPVAGDVSHILDGTFDPTSVFMNSLNATILGGVKLIDLIQTVTGLSGDSPSAQAMQILYSTVGSPGAAADLRRAHVTPPVPPVPTTRTTHFHWEPEIKANPIVSGDPTASFTLDGTVTADLVHPANSTFKLTGDLKTFIVSLMDNSGGGESFIAIHMNELSFVAGSGQKSSVKVDIGAVDFLGVLQFIEQLEEFMDFSGDGGPKITIEPDGISADLAVSLPPIAVGIFSLSNIGVDAGFNLPFDGSPARFRFSFATQDNPFTLSVAIFGGGGFFGIAIGTDGVELIQASFDFGAMASVNLGVASGSVQLVAGIYFAYGQINPPSTTTGCILTGFVKLDGSLSILGIITLSLEFDMSLTYSEPPSEVTGTATLSVSVSVLFFSFSVSVTASKTFGGGSDGSNIRHASVKGHLSPHTGSDVPPTFVSQVPTAAIWNSYCAAFATD